MRSVFHFGTDTGTDGDAHAAGAGAPPSASPATPPTSSFSPVRLEDREFEVLRRLIHAETGISLAPSKRVLLESRLARRLRALELDSFTSYCHHLKTRLDEELVPLINCVTTNKTEFFREAHHFEFLRSHVLPAADARAGRTGRHRLRIWSAGCSTGEEPYSLALTLLEWLEDRPGWDVKILASDIDTNVLDAASRGCYPAERLEDVPLLWRRRWFRELPERPGWMQADDALRSMIAFRRINLNEEQWPIRTTFDVILCRNVIIYFNRATQTNLLGRFARLLDADGHLIIGHSESLAWLCDTFSAVRGQPTVYRLTSAARRESSPAAPAPAPTPAAAPSARERAAPRGVTSDAASTPASPGANGMSGAATRIGSTAGAAARGAVMPSTTTVGARPSAGSAPRGAGSHDASAQASAVSVAKARRALATDAPEASSVTNVDGAPIYELAAGATHASATPEIVHAIIGSGVAVALFDAESHVGALHYVLPQAPLTASRVGANTPSGDTRFATSGASTANAACGRAIEESSLERSVARRASCAAHGDANDLEVDARETASRADERDASLRALLDSVLRAGAVRAQVRAKMFGGASPRVEPPAADASGDAVASAVASAVAGVRAFLGREGIPIVAERIGGGAPIELLFHVDSGRARVRELPVAAWSAVRDREGSPKVQDDAILVVDGTGTEA